jgi:hypothetical protein
VLRRLRRIIPEDVKDDESRMKVGSWNVRKICR